MHASLGLALQYLKSTRDIFIQDLQTILRFPSVAVDPARQSAVAETISWLQGRLKTAGFNHVEILETPGLPVILADTGSESEGSPCILIYAHYDVQSEDPPDSWSYPPFDPHLEGEYLYGRGAADMKGPLMACLAAVEAWTRTGACPVRIKMLIEGEEELGSPHLGRLVFEQRERLQADLGLNLDAGMIGRDMPTITTALRGAMLFDVTVKGPERDLHSGIFGGLVENPVHVLCRVLSGLQDPDGLIMLPGFYDRVHTVESQHRQSMGTAHETLLNQVGAAGLPGDRQFNAFERTTIRPSMDVLQISGGAPKTAIPSEAAASVSLRIVPDQEMDEIHASMQDYITAVVPKGVRWNLQWKVGVPPVHSDPDFYGNQAMAHAMRAAWGTEPLFMPGGGTIPVVPMLKEILGIESVLCGFSLPDDNMHGPDERIHLPTLQKGREALVHFFSRLACS